MQMARKSASKSAAVTAPAKAAPDTVRAMLEHHKSEFATALPAHIQADKFIRVALTTIRRSPNLQRCSAASLAGALVECAQLGLQPDGLLGEAYLVPYGTEAKLIPGYRGLVGLARRSGQVRVFDAKCVYEGDKFDYEFGLDPKLSHKPAIKGRGELTHVYALCIYKDGGSQFEVMTREEVDAIRKRSKASGSGPWVTDYDQMARKTVIRRLAKLLPLSPEFSKAAALAEAEETLEIKDVEFTEPEKAPAIERVTAGDSSTHTGPGEPLSNQGADDEGEPARAGGPMNEDMFK
jgi:recombination protein RecT